jgi:hypothetical protein
MIISPFYSTLHNLKSRDRAVGIELCYGLDDRGSRFRFPAGAGNFSLHHRVQNGSWAHTASYPMGTRGSFPGVKRPVREADHPLHLVPRSKNEWSYSSTPPILFHGMVLSQSTGTTLPFLPLLHNLISRNSVVEITKVKKH